MIGLQSNCQRYPNPFTTFQQLTRIVAVSGGPEHIADLCKIIEGCAVLTDSAKMCMVRPRTALTNPSCVNNLYNRVLTYGVL